MIACVCLRCANASFKTSFPLDVISYFLLSGPILPFSQSDLIHSFFSIFRSVLYRLPISTFSPQCFSNPSIRPYPCDESFDNRRRMQGSTNLPIYPKLRRLEASLPISICRYHIVKRFKSQGIHREL